MQTTVKLHGWVGKKYGKTFKMSVHTPAQAISLLKANFKDFANDIIKFNGGYRVHVGKESVEIDRLKNISGNKTIHIVPVVAGSGKGVGQLISGIALMAVAYFVPFSAPWIGQALFSFGTSLVIGGVMQMITPTLKTNAFDSERPDNKPSYSFNGPVNTVGQGNPVSVLYGKLLIGSQVISAGLSTRQI